MYYAMSITLSQMGLSLFCINNKSDVNNMSLVVCSNITLFYSYVREIT